MILSLGPKESEEQTLKNKGGLRPIFTKVSKNNVQSIKKAPESFTNIKTVKHGLHSITKRTKTINSGVKNRNKSPLFDG